MILGFDIGNTSTTAGVYRDDAVAPDHTFRFPTVKNAGPIDLHRQILDGLTRRGAHGDGMAVSGLAFSSVVPEINDSYRRMAKERYGVPAFEVTCRSLLNFRIVYDDPRQLGADRIVNAAAAFREYGGGSVVVDIGTAVTFCVLLEDGVFDGGIIAPGIGTSISTLAARASRLPEVKFEIPDRLVARNTENALKSGFFYGWLSLAEGIIARIEREYGRSFRVILTGGYAGAVAEHLGHENTLDHLLAMKGIKILYDMNR